MQVRAELARVLEQRAHAAGGVVAAALRASGRRSGVSAETLTDKLARGSGPAASASSAGRSGQRAFAFASSSSASRQRAA